MVLFTVVEKKIAQNASTLFFPLIYQNQGFSLKFHYGQAFLKHLWHNNTTYGEKLYCKESKTDSAYEAIATFEVTTYSDGIKKRYIGKSTRPVKKTRRPKNEKKTMAQEAKKAALMEYFKERFGFTNFDDIHRDELHRPIKM